MALKRTVGRLTLAMVVVMVAALAVAGCGGQAKADLSLERVKSSGRLIVGMDPSYPPFEGYDEKGQLAGYDVDMARTLAREMGAEAHFAAIDVNGIVDALVARKVDVVISSMGPLPEYRKQLAFSAPYFQAGQVVVVPQGVTDIAGLADLAGRTVAVESGSIGEMEMRKEAKRLDGLSLHPAITAEEALKALRDGWVQVAVVDAVSAHQFIRAEGGLQVVGEPVTDEPLVVSCRRGDVALLTEVDRIIEQWRANGYLAELAEKWL